MKGFTAIELTIVIFIVVLVVFVPFALIGERNRHEAFLVDCMRAGERRTSANTNGSKCIPTRSWCMRHLTDEFRQSPTRRHVPRPANPALPLRAG